MVNCSDAYQVVVCTRCGSYGRASSHAGRSYVCVSKTCKNNITEFQNIEIPYALKLMTQELMAMGIRPRMNVAIPKGIAV
jgi:DNA-directed RNA polymerase II subunit RPB2